MKYFTPIFVNGVIALLWFYYFQARIAEFANLLISRSAIFGGGFLSGGIHALSGPDHLAAIIPFSVGQSWLHGVTVGSIWGLGHGMSAFIIGYCGYHLKESLSSEELLNNLSNLSSFAVGTTLVVMGLMGIFERTCDMDSSEEVDSSKSGQEQNSRKSSTSTLSCGLLMNGFFLGLSWDSIPSMAPALAMTSTEELLFFLTAYVIGTIACVSLTAGLIGSSTSYIARLSKANLPKRLALASSTVSVIVGTGWLGHATYIYLVQSNKVAYNLPLILGLVLAGGTPLAILGIIATTTWRRIVSTGMDLDGNFDTKNKSFFHNFLSGSNRSPENNTE